MRTAQQEDTLSSGPWGGLGVLHQRQATERRWFFGHHRNLYFWWGSVKGTMFSSTLLWKGRIMSHTKGQGIQEGLQLRQSRGTMLLQITFLKIKEGVVGTYTLQSLLQPSSVGHRLLSSSGIGSSVATTTDRESWQSRLKSRVKVREVGPFRVPCTWPGIWPNSTWERGVVGGQRQYTQRQHILFHLLLLVFWISFISSQIKASGGKKK